MSARAATILEKSLGPFHPDVATALFSCAELLRKQAIEYPKRRENSIEIVLSGDIFILQIHRLFVIIKASHARRHKSVCKGIHRDLERSMQSVCFVLIPWELDMVLYAKFSIKCERQFQKGCIKICWAFVDIFSLPSFPYVLGFFYQERHVQAGPLYKRVLHIREKALGPDHLDVAESLGVQAWYMIRKVRRETIASK